MEFISITSITSTSTSSITSSITTILLRELLFFLNYYNFNISLNMFSTGIYSLECFIKYAFKNNIDSFRILYEGYYM
jgi:hypothetical protein